MMACKADGAVMVIGRVIMVMGHSHESGKEEQHDKKCCKSIAASHVVMFTHS